jgi:hypothetical protein
MKDVLEMLASTALNNLAIIRSCEMCTEAEIWAALSPHWSQVTAVPCKELPDAN